MRGFAKDLIDFIEGECPIFDGKRGIFFKCILFKILCCVCNLHTLTLVTNKLFKLLVDHKCWQMRYILIDTSRQTFSQLRDNQLLISVI